MKLDFSNKKKNVILILLLALIVLLCMKTFKVDLWVYEDEFSFAQLNDAVSTYDELIGLEDGQQKAIGVVIRILSLLPIIAGFTVALFIIEKEKYFYATSMITAIIALGASVIIFIAAKANEDLSDFVGFTFLFSGIPAACIGIIIQAKGMISASDISLSEVKEDIKNVADKVGQGVAQRPESPVAKPVKAYNMNANHMNANLLMIVGDMQGMSVPLTNEHLIVGRDASVAHIVLKNKTISRKHCEFYKNGDHVFVTDYSKTGTFINGTVKLGFGQRHELKEGDMISLGDKSQVFKIE